MSKRGIRGEKNPPPSLSAAPAGLNNGGNAAAECTARNTQYLRSRHACRGGSGRSRSRSAGQRLGGKKKTTSERVRSLTGGRTRRSKEVSPTSSFPLSRCRRHERGNGTQRRASSKRLLHHIRSATGANTCYCSRTQYMSSALSPSLPRTVHLRSLSTLTEQIAYSPPLLSLPGTRHSRARRHGAKFETLLKEFPPDLRRGHSALRLARSPPPPPPRPPTSPFHFSFFESADS